MRKLLMIFAVFATGVAATETEIKDTLLCPNGKVVETVNKGSKEQRAITANLNIDQVRKWFRDLPGWQARKDPDSLLQAMQNNCKTTKLPDGWDAICQQLKTTKVTDVYGFIEQNFTPYQMVAEQQEKGTFTSYYASYVNVSRTKTAIYKFPIYQNSPKARTLSRKQIEQGELAESEVLFWSDNDFDSYVLGVQGSGIGHLPDGKKVKIAYASKNTDNYVSIGKVLIECGDIAQANMSLPAIRKWVNQASVTDYQRLLSNNQSYVFFREEAFNGEAPKGALGIPLTPMRSLAVDVRYIPLGTMAYVAVPHPLNDETIEQVFIAQDKGGAINGGIRADIFAGIGKDAGAFAGRMKHQGHFWLIKPNLIP